MEVDWTYVKFKTKKQAENHPKAEYGNEGKKESTKNLTRDKSIS